MVVADGQRVYSAGVPLGVRITSASPTQVTFCKDTLEAGSVPRKRGGAPRRKPRRLIADKAYDADWLRWRLKHRGIELICPHRSNRKKKPMQNGRSLRSYKRRWTVERTIGWLQNFRRLVVRYERYPSMYLAFVQVACLMITLRKL